MKTERQKLRTSEAFKRNVLYLFAVMVSETWFMAGRKSKDYDSSQIKLDHSPVSLRMYSLLLNLFITKLEAVGEEKWVWWVGCYNS